MDPMSANLETATDSTPKELPIKDFKKIVDDLKGVIGKIQKIAGISVTSNNLHSEDIEELVLKHPNGRKIISLVGQYRASEASPRAIASILNRAEHRTFRGGDKWTEEDIQEVLKIVDDNRALYFKLISGSDQS